MSTVAQEQAKNIISDALFGEADLRESIEQLTELLFPGEKLIEQIRNQKIVKELEYVVKLLQEKIHLTLTEIQKRENTFYISLAFDDLNEFTSEQNKIAAVFAQKAKKYDVSFEMTYILKQMISA